MASLGLLVLRLAVATVLCAHGANTLFGAFGGPGIGVGGPAATAAHLASIGAGSGLPIAIAIGLIQFGGGCLLGLGLFTRVAASLVIGLLLFEVWKEFGQWGFFLNWTFSPGRGHGIEAVVVLAGALVNFVVAGAGDWSLDGMRENSYARRASGRARLRGR